MKEQLIEKMIREIHQELGHNPGVTARSSIPQYIGKAFGDTIGLLIPAVSPELNEIMDLKGYRSLGMIGSRVGAGPQIMAADMAVKSTNTEVLSIEYPRDTKGGAGRGCLIYLGAKNVTDAKEAVEIILNHIDKFFGDVYSNETGHLEFQYSARAGSCLEKAYGSPAGKAFGLVTGAPAAIGTVLADVALKAAQVEVCTYRSPLHGNSNSNEVTLIFSGESAAVRQSVAAAREIGKGLLGTMGAAPASQGVPYI